MNNMFEDMLKEHDLDEVAHFYFGDSCNWAEMEVFYSSKLGRFFWISGSGCSCSYLREDIYSLEDMQDGTRESCISWAKTFAEESAKYSYNYVDINSIAGDIYNYRSES
jgi:hypothetical protein